MRLSSMLVPLLVFSLACGDDDSSTDAGSDGGTSDASTPDANPGDTGSPGPRDAGEADAGPNDGGAVDAGGADAGGTDAGGTDAGGADAGGADAGPALPVCGPGVEGSCCFDISETLGDLPFVLPDTFNEATPTWNRPTDDCPSDALSEDAVPFVTYTYCNYGEAAADFQFEVLAVEEDGPVPVLVAYSGSEINADPLMCGAFNEPLLGLAELVITLAPNEVVTIVSTTRDAMDYGDIQSIAGEPAE
ncbi:MAG: hypothetical protein AB8H86_27650 [Polyangiales bacterium]